MYEATLTETIRKRRIDFKNRSNSEMQNRVRVLRAEIVKLSFEKEPSLKKHRYLMNELEKAKLGM